MRLLSAVVASFIYIGSWPGASPAEPPRIDLQALTDGSDAAAGTSEKRDAKALQEMFGSSRGPQRWKQPPELTILTSVMEYRAGGGVEYVATQETLSTAEIDQLVRDLTDGLAVLTANTFEQFSSVTHAAVPAGATASVSRPHQIVAGRFSGLQRSANKLGFGGRRARKDGTITAGAILLDSEVDRTHARRRLLRTHELGHALGYNHVYSRTSIMNPRIGTEVNDFDRESALIAFVRAPDSAR